MPDGMEAGVAEIGGELRRARIARKQSIEDIARATKITPTQVGAIEREDFARLPGGLFTRGFLRAYAREVGVDAEEIVARYREEVEPQAAAEPESASRPAFEAAAAIRTPVDLEDTGRSRQVQILQLCIILLIV